MYFSTSLVLISAGGHETIADPPRVTFPNRFCLFSSCPWDGGKIRKAIESLFANVAQSNRGWSRPTTIVPSKETSDDMLDMMRFLGRRYSAKGTRNLCVGPNFACGLQLTYGNVVEPILDDCSIVNGNWRFIDFTTPKCLDYGYYMAVYSRSCSIFSKCKDKADNYGLVEISERINTISFESFQQTVLSNNPNPFASNGVQTYFLVSGRAIEFEINPRYKYESQIIRVEGIDRDSNDLVLGRRYQYWPKAWSSKGSFQSLSMSGRWTFDSKIDLNSSIAKRCIIDVTDPINPKRITTTLPQLLKRQMVQQSSLSYDDGRYFDDSGSVLDSDMIQTIHFYYNTSGVTGFRMTWRRSGLQSIHGYVPASKTFSTFGRLVEYEFDIDEHITTVGIGTTSWFGQRRISRVRIVTDKNRNIVVGYGTTEDNEYTDDHIVALHGRASDDMLYQIGVTTMMNNE